MVLKNPSELEEHIEICKESKDKGKLTNGASASAFVRAWGKENGLDIYTKILKWQKRIMEATKPQGLGWSATNYSYSLRGFRGARQRHANNQANNCIFRKVLGISVLY